MDAKVTSLEIDKLLWRASKGEALKETSEDILRIIDEKVSCSIPSQNEEESIHVFGSLMQLASSLKDIEITSSIVDRILSWGDELMSQDTANAQVVSELVAKMTLPYLSNEEQVKRVLCPTFVEALCKPKGGIANLQHIIKQISHLMSCHANKENKMQITILKQLISRPVGTIQFDKVTGTSLLHDTSKCFTETTIKSLSKFLCRIIKEDSKILEKQALGDKSTKHSSLDCVHAAHWLSLLLCHNVMNASKYIKWKAKQTAFLLRVAFFTKLKEKELNLLQQAYRRAFDQPLKELEEQLLFVEIIVAETDAALKDDPLGCKLNVGNRMVWKKTLKMWSTMKQGSDSAHFHLHIFRLLFCHMSLQLFMDKNMDNLNDLHQCYERALNSHLPLVKDNNKGSPQWTHVIVDILLSLLSKGDHYLRRVVICCFKTLCHLMEPESVVLIIDAIVLTKQDLSEKDSLIDEESDDESGDDEADDDDDDLEGDEEEEGDCDVDEEDDEQEEEEDEEKLGDETKLELLNLQGKMHECLRLNMGDIELDSVPPEEMSKLDDVLGPLFRQYVNAKKGVKPKRSKDAISLSHFRIRVCDLLEALITEAPSPSHILKVISPLLRFISIVGSTKTNDYDQLSMKLQNLLLKLSKIRSFKNTANISAEEVAQQLDSIFSIGSKAFGNLVVHRIVKSLCTFLVTLSFNLFDEKEEDNVVLQTYLKHWQAFLFNKFWSMPGDVLSGPLSTPSGSLATVSLCLIDGAFVRHSRLHRRMKAMEFLCKVFNNSPAMNKMAPDALRRMNQTISHHVPQIFDGIKTPQFIKRKVMRCLLNLLIAIHFFHKRNSSCKESFDWDAISESIKSFYERVDITGMKELDSVVKRLSNQLRVSLAQSPKREKPSKKRKREREEEEDQDKGDQEEDQDQDKEVDLAEDKDDNSEKEDLMSEEVKKEKKRSLYDKSTREKRKRQHERKRLRRENLQELLSVPELDKFSFSVNKR